MITEFWYIHTCMFCWIAKFTIDIKIYHWIRFIKLARIEKASLNPKALLYTSFSCILDFLAPVSRSLPALQVNA